MIQQLLHTGPLLLVALLVMTALTLVFVRSASAALWTLVVVFVTTQGVVPPLELQVTQAGISVYPLDLVVGLMFAIGVFRLLTQPTPTAVSLPLVALSALFLIHLVWGTAIFGLQVAVNSSRLWLALLGPLVYCAVAPRAWSRRSFLPLIAGAGALAAFALVQIARHGLYGANEYITVGGQFIDARPVTASGSLLIVQCLLIAVAGRFVRSFQWLIAVLMFGAAVMLLQHRTVWIVALLVGVVAYVRWARTAIHVNERAAALAATTVLLISPLILTAVRIRGEMRSTVVAARAAARSFTWIAVRAHLT